MTMYNVHIYREMRLNFQGIEADTHAAAAAIAHDKPTSEADEINDCEGESLAALVDVQGDEDYGQSCVIDFEGVRERKATPALLEACELLDWAYRNAETSGSVSWEALNDAWAKARSAIALLTGDTADEDQPSIFDEMVSEGVDLN
jgi:hypothetical protein